MSTKITIDLEDILATIKESCKKIKYDLNHYRWDTLGVSVVGFDHVDLKSYYSTLIDEYQYINRIYMSLFSSECSLVKSQEDENIREFWKAIRELNDEIDAFIETVRERLDKNPYPVLFMDGLPHDFE